MVELHLIQGPYVTERSGAARLAIPTGAERMTVLIALRGPLLRQRTAALLWPTATASRGAGNLRSALWRLRTADLELIIEVDGRLRLSPGVTVDVWQLGSPHGFTTAERIDPLPFLARALNLLPGWYDDWLAADRERIRELALDALDRLSDRLRRAGRSSEAIEAALLATTSDPLRESSQVALVRAYLEEGNVVEARRAYAGYQVQLGTDAGIGPSAVLTRMISSAD